MALQLLAGLLAVVCVPLLAGSAVGVVAGATVVLVTPRSGARAAVVALRHGAVEALEVSVRVAVLSAVGLGAAVGLVGAVG